MMLLSASSLSPYCSIQCYFLEISCYGAILSSICISGCVTHLYYIFSWQPLYLLEYYFYMPMQAYLARDKSATSYLLNRTTKSTKVQRNGGFILVIKPGSKKESIHLFTG